VAFRRPIVGPSTAHEEFRLRNGAETGQTKRRGVSWRPTAIKDLLLPFLGIDTARPLDPAVGAREHVCG